MKKKDLKTIDKLEKENFKYPWSIKIIEETLDYSNVPQIKALINNKIIGYIFWNIYGIDLLPQESEILNIAVSKQYRQQGIANNLILEIEKIMPKSVKNIFLELREDNIAAFNLYTKLGFKKIGLRKNYYKDKQNAILMQKLLKR